MVGGIIPERSVSSEVGSRSALRARRLTRPVHLGLLPLSFNCSASLIQAEAVLTCGIRVKGPA